jgi:cell shape-determining protein MreD
MQKTNKIIRYLFLQNLPYLYLVIGVLFPSFLTYGKAHFAFPLLFFWSLCAPNRLPCVSIIVMSLVQDILLDYYLGSHGIIYAVFMGILLYQRFFLYKRSFYLKWTVFSILLLVMEIVKLFFFTRSGSYFFYSLLIPIVSFPLMSERVQLSLISMLRNHVK